MKIALLTIAISWVLGGGFVTALELCGTLRANRGEEPAAPCITILGIAALVAILWR